MAIKLTTALRNNIMDQVTADIDSGAGAGTLKIYDGTQPAGPDTAITSQVLLVTITFNDPSFDPASGGAIVADVTPALSGTAVATSTATWFRIEDSDSNAVADGSAGDVGSEDLVLNTDAIVTGVTVEVTSMTLTAGNA